MKKIILFSLLWIISVSLFSQNYTLNYNYNQTAITCLATFKERDAGNYSENEDLWMTFQPTGNQYSRVAITFSQFDVHPSDTFYIYDGSSITAPLMGAYNNNNSVVLNSVIHASFANTSGILTFRLKSDHTNTATGWIANISCFDICQTAIINLDTLLTLPHPTNGFIKLCKEDTVTFSCNVSFPENDLNYHQSIANSIIEWKPDFNITKTGQTIQHSYNTNGGKMVYINYTDSIGCKTKDSVEVRVSNLPPVVTHPLNDICTGNTQLLTAGYLPNSIFELLPAYSNKVIFNNDLITFIPDGPQCPPGILQTSIIINNNPTTAVIASAGDIEAICINMEHSFAGDLGFKIICPNGQSTILDPNTHSGSAFLGIPFGGIGHHTYDNGCFAINNMYGAGWNYCWSEIHPNNNLTLDQLSSSSGPGTVMVNGSKTIDSTNQINRSNYIKPQNSLSSLIGCPLNGLWTMEITDDYALDNGYLFHWDLQFNSNLTNNPPVYSLGVSSMQLTGTNLTSINDSAATISTPIAGILPYSLNITDDYGCSESYQTMLQIFESPTVDLGHDTSLCGFGAVQLNALNATNYNCQFIWNTGAATAAITVYAELMINSYIVIVSENHQNVICSANDTISIVASIALPDNAGNIIGPVSVCEGLQNANYIIPPIANAFQYVWSYNNTIVSTQLNNNVLIDFSTTSPVNLSVYGKNGCGNGLPSSIAVTVIPAPPPAYIHQNGNTLFSDVTSGNQWYMIGFGILAGDTNQQLNITQNGTYYCIVTSDITGCQSDTSNILYINSLSVKDLDKPFINIKVFPNPFTNMTTFSYDLAQNASIEIKIYSITGQMETLIPLGMQCKGNHQVELNATHLKPGLYFYQLKSDQHMYTGKLIRY